MDYISFSYVLMPFFFIGEDTNVKEQITENTLNTSKVVSKSIKAETKAIPVTGRGGL
jgi:hypothetical protein